MLDEPKLAFLKVEGEGREAAEGVVTEDAAQVDAEKVLQVIEGAGREG